MKITENNWKEELIIKNNSEIKNHIQGELVCIKCVEQVVESLITSIKQEERERAMQWMDRFDTYHEGAGPRWRLDAFKKYIQSLTEDEM